MKLELELDVLPSRPKYRRKIIMPTLVHFELIRLIIEIDSAFAERSKFADLFLHIISSWLEG